MKGVYGDVDGQTQAKTTQCGRVRLTGLEIIRSLEYNLSLLQHEESVCVE